MKILVIRFSSIGDIVLTTPVVRCLKKQLPGCEVHFLTKYAYREIIEANPYLSGKHYLKDDFRSLLKELKKENFDYIIDLHNNLRTWRVKMTLFKKSTTFNKLNFEKWLYVNLRVNILPDVHIAERYLEAARDLGVRNDGKGLDYFLSPADEIKVSDLPLTHLHGYIAMAIGARHETKKLPLEKLKDLCRELNYPIMLLGGKEDAENAEILHALDPVKIFNGCGKFTLNQSASLVRTAKMVITHDTGLMHIAAAFKKRIFSVWGNTVPEFGMYPYYGSSGGSNSEIFEIRPLNCRPCSKLGYKKCPRGHFKCMNLIDTKMIAQAVQR